MTVQNSNVPITCVVVGCGNRGTIYANYALHNPEKFKIVACADPVEFRRNDMAKNHNIPNELVFDDWRKIAKLPKLADSIIIATLDRDHLEPTIAFANLKYHILLEKPMSINYKDCELMTQAVINNQIYFAIGHVLRYTSINKQIKHIIDRGDLGKIVNIQHLEPIGFYHFAHSFVRGNWRNKEETTFSLMQKSCHDLDLILYFMNHQPCVKVSSMGNLYHFKRENLPSGAENAENCLSCPVESTCPYSAKKIYLDKLINENHKGWPLNTICDVVDIENVTNVLKNGAYGKCVYKMDNDVNDHQVVNMQFEDGSTATFSMVAFTESMCRRKTKIFGTLGELTSDGIDTIEVFDFLTKSATKYDTSISSESDQGLSGHGGGDFGLISSFVDALASQDPSKILSTVAQTLESHQLVFASEYARIHERIIRLKPFFDQVHEGELSLDI